MLWLCKPCSNSHPVSSKAGPSFPDSPKVCPSFPVPFHSPIASPKLSLSYLGPQGTMAWSFPLFCSSSKFSWAFSVVSSSIPYWWYLEFEKLFWLHQRNRSHERVRDSRVPSSAMVYGLKFLLLYVRWLFILQYIVIKPLLNSRWSGLHSHHFAKLLSFSLTPITFSWPNSLAWNSPVPSSFRPTPKPCSQQLI